MSFFQKINPKVSLERQDQLLDPVLYGDPKTSDLYILTSEPNKGFIKYYQKVIEKYVGANTKFCVLYSYIFVPKGNDDKNLGDFVRANSIDTSKYIKPWSKIICTGRAIYTITQETELKTEAFYAYDYVQSWFFDSKTKSWVFPVDDPFKFVSLASKKYLDTFAFHFFQHQIIACRDLEARPIRLSGLNVVVVDEPNEFLKQYIGKNVKVAWDLETDGLLFYKCHVICLTLSFDGKTGYYLPWSKIDPIVLTDFFEGKYQIGANLKFDVKFLRLNGVENVHVDFDTMAAGHVLNEMRSNSLGSHGWIYTYYGGHEVPLLKYKKAHPAIKNYGQIPKSILADYAAKDAIITYKVYEKELELLEEDRKRRGEKPSLYDYFFNEMMPNINMYIQIEMNGIYMDIKRLDDFSTQLRMKQMELEDIIYGEVGHKFNLGSTQELSKVLRYELKWPNLGTLNKSGEFLTGEEALDEWEKRGYKLATVLKQWKEISTFIKTFAGTKDKPESGWRRFVDSEGFLHPSYQVMMAESGRQKASDPNWQQCFTKDCQLLTDSGYYSFEELFKEYPEGVSDYKGTLKVIDEEGREDTIESVYKGTSREIYRFVLRNYCRSLSVTPDHNCFVYRDNKEIMVKASEVRMTDLFLMKGEKFNWLVPLECLDVITYTDPIDVFCITTERHRIVVNRILTSQCPKQGTYAKDFRMVFQPPTDSRHFVYGRRSMKLTLEDGTELEFSLYEDIKVKRNGEEIVIQARDLQEGDDFIKVV